MRDRSFRIVIGALVVVGVALRLALAHRYPGNLADVPSGIYAADQFTRHGLHAYSYYTQGGIRWPYPPFWLPISAAVLHLGRALSVSDQYSLRVPLVICDGILIWLVQAVIGWRGGSRNLRIGAAAIVAVGPPFLWVTVLQGQLDDVVALTVLAAIACWLRAPASSRWLYAGVALGVGAATKEVPLLALIALFPTAVDNRERVKLTAVAVAIPVLCLLPFELADHATLHVLSHYTPLPGAGGLSLLVQPSLADHWWYPPIHLNLANRVLKDLAHPALLIGLAAAGWYAYRRRLDPPSATVLVYAVAIVVTPSFFLQYGVWVIIPALAIGAWRSALAVCVLWVLPAVVVNDLNESLLGVRTPPPKWAWTGVYLPSAALLFLAAVGAVVAVVLRSHQPAIARPD